LKISENKLQYIDQLIELVEEYRVFCGSTPSPCKTRQFFQRLLDNKESVTFVAIDDKTKKLMGFINLYPSYSTLSLKRLWILNDLGVSTHFRGQGVAKNLINKAISFAISTNAVRIEFKTQKKNTNAQKLYKSLGFLVDEENIHYNIPI
jgi:ribosomal protein S18 acetylase RimI-like enzyme